MARFDADRRIIAVVTTDPILASEMDRRGIGPITDQVCIADIGTTPTAVGITAAVRPRLMAAALLAEAAFEWRAQRRRTPGSTWQLAIGPPPEAAAAAGLRSYRVVGLGGTWNWRDHLRQTALDTLTTIDAQYDTGRLIAAEVRVHRHRFGVFGPQLPSTEQECGHG